MAHHKMLGDRQERMFLAVYIRKGGRQNNSIMTTPKWAVREEVRKMGQRGEGPTEE